jgi:hypothetical protein
MFEGLSFKIPKNKQPAIAHRRLLRILGIIPEFSNKLMQGVINKILDIGVREYRERIRF